MSGICSTEELQSSRENAEELANLPELGCQGLRTRKFRIGYDTSNGAPTGPPKVQVVSRNVVFSANGEAAVY